MKKKVLVTKDSVIHFIIGHTSVFHASNKSGFVKGDTINFVAYDYLKKHELDLYCNCIVTAVLHYRENGPLFGKVALMLEVLSSSIKPLNNG
jgi:hypothetical protein